VSRYLGALVISILIVGWVTVVCLRGTSLHGASQLSGEVARGTSIVRDQLQKPRPDVLQDRMFPEGRLINAVKETWRTGIKVRGYPSSLIDEPPDASARAALGPTRGRTP
jgi:hypothetical protein